MDKPWKYPQGAWTGELQLGSSIRKGNGSFKWASIYPYFVVFALVSVPDGSLDSQGVDHFRS